MRSLIARFLAVLILLTAAAPGFASADVAGAHAGGCDMAAMNHAGHETPDRMPGDTEGLRVCPLAASCFTGLTVFAPPLREMGEISNALFLPVSPRAIGAADFELDPPPPRQI